MSDLSFDAADLNATLDALSDDDKHQLPFGVIGLDREQRVRFYSHTEARLSGLGDRPIIGLDFFAQIAPCMNTGSFRGRIEEALRTGKLDIEIGHTGDFSDRSRFMRVRIMSAADGGFWLVNQR